MTIIAHCTNSYDMDVQSFSDHTERASGVGLENQKRFQGETASKLSHRG